MKKFLLCSLLFHFVCFAAFAQKELNVWYFGDKAGLDFNSGAPIALTNGQMTTNEGCSSICDVNGQLLFYTEGDTIWSSNHTVMPNGKGLTGQPRTGTGSPTSSTTQASMIVPAPKRPGMYYVFSLSSSTGGATIPGVLYYSIVNMNLNGGLGDVVSGQKGIQIDTGLTEGLTAARHANESDVWIVVQAKNDSFIAYHVDAGQVGGRVSSNVGLPKRTPRSSAGCIAISPNSKKLAVAKNGLDFTLLDFDNATGIVSNPVALAPQNGSYLLGYLPYGVAFSPDSKILYGSEITKGDIFQWNVMAGSSAAIAASAVVVGTAAAKALQLGPDRKIYIAKIQSQQLSVISNPNVLGAGCNFGFNAVNLNGKQSFLGLPNQMQSYFDTVIPHFIRYADTCIDGVTHFSITPALVYADSVRWYFLNTLSDRLGTDTGIAPTYTYTTAGTFTVTAIIYRRGVADTIRTQVTIDPAIDVHLGNDTAICEGASVLLKAPVTDTNYLWQDGSKGNTYKVTKSGSYSLAVVNVKGCMQSDTINVDVQKPLHLDLGEDVVECTGIPIEITLQANAPANDMIHWSDGSSDATLFVKDVGTYWVVVTGVCISRDTIHIAQESCDCNIGIPTVFTPNNDGRNDVFRPVIQPGCPAKGFVMNIYDRWGQKVYTTTDLSRPWDGTMRGTPCDIGTYMFQVDITTGTGQNRHTFKGDVTLIR